MARLCRHRFGPKPMPARPAFALIPSYPCSSVFPLLGPERHTHAGLVHHGDRSDRSVRTRRTVGTVPCVAGSSTWHWQDYQANQRVIGMSIEISSRLAVICRISNADGRSSGPPGQHPRPRPLSRAVSSCPILSACISIYVSNFPFFRQPHSAACVSRGLGWSKTLEEVGQQFNVTREPHPSDRGEVVLKLRHRSRSRLRSLLDD